MGLFRKALLLIALSFAFIPGEAFAVCTGQFLGGTLCGNNTSGQAIPGPTANPILGVPGTNTGSMGFAGSGSGTATVSAQGAAGTPTLLLPTVSGTFPSTASAPLVLNAVTGALTCATCVTSSGGGAITGVSPINVSAAGAVSLQGATGSIVVGSGGTGSLFTPTPVLGVAGSVVGSLGFQNATSGTVTLQPVTGALGASVLSLPAITDTLAGKALANGGTNASLVASNGGIVWSNATQLQILAGTATANQMLLSGASATPSWSTATFPATVTGAGQVMNSTAANVWGATATPTLGVAGSVVGSLAFANATSGTETITPATGALGSGVATLPAGTYNIVGDTLTQTLTNKTLATPTINGATLSGTFSGNATFSGNDTFSGNNTFSGQLIETGTTAPASAGGQTVVLGSLVAAPTLTNTGQAFFYNNTTTGAVVQGDGSSFDVVLDNKGGTAVCSIATGTTTLTCTNMTVNTTFTATGLVTYADLATAALATQSQYFSAAANTIVPTNIIYTSEQTTTFGATTTFDFSTFINTAVTLTANITTQTLSNVKAGQAGQIRFIQDGAGSHTTVWNSIFKFSGGTTPTLSTAANAIDVLFYSCVSTSLCYASLTLNMK